MLGIFLIKDLMSFFFFQLKSEQVFLVFLVEQRGTLLRLLWLTVTNLFGFERLISWQYAADRPVMAFSCLFTP